MIRVRTKCGGIIADNHKLFSTTDLADDTDYLDHELHEFAFISEIRVICFIVPKELVFIHIPLRDDGTD